MKSIFCFKLALSSSSVPSANATLQLSTQLSEQLDEQQLSHSGDDRRQFPLTHNKEFKLEIERRLKRDYPRGQVLSISLLVISLSSANIYFERAQADRFEIDDIYVFSYRSLSGLALLAALVNIIVSILAILTSRGFKNLVLK